MGDVAILVSDVTASLDDTGRNVDTIPSLNLNNSYFNVYINGVIQMDDNFAIRLAKKVLETFSFPFQMVRR
ncbi:DUF4183 domain-containing protein [Neobacillus sp. B4I6]|uniref:DUF4183 domain-containing protein n=1 Tax=Neobacillus sp. B4I6 TaxID=3373925 RepID=UPI003D20ED53